jgi:hypothetical protein
VGEWPIRERERERERAATAILDKPPTSHGGTSVLRGILGKPMETSIHNSLLYLRYVRDAQTKIPKSTRHLWRYMDIGKFVSMLDHGGLYFPALSALGDKLEGAPSRLSEGATEADRLIALAQFSQVRCSVFVNCWYMFKDESSAMWSLYGDQGVAIRTH